MQNYQKKTFYKKKLLINNFYSTFEKKLFKIIKMKVSNFVYSLFALIAVVVILIYGKSIILPFVLAVIVWFLIKVVRNFVAKIKNRNKSLPLWVQTIISVVIIFGILGLTSKLLLTNISQMTEVLPGYEKKILNIATQLNELTGKNIVKEINDFTGDYDFSEILKSIFNSIYELFANTFLIILYVLFLLLEESYFRKKIKAMFTAPEKYSKIDSMLKELNKSINSYISLKTLVSLITGVVSYVILIIIGVDFAFLWAFLIFMLNYIPTIGSLIATIFPATIALLQFGTYTEALTVLIFIGATQVVVGNIIEPKIMGKSLNISSLVVLLSLSFWGSVWGIVGMVLSVPITVMLIIVFAKFKKTRNIAIILSEKGEVE